MGSKMGHKLEVKKIDDTRPHKWLFFYVLHSY